MLSTRESVGYDKNAIHVEYKMRCIWKNLTEGKLLWPSISKVWTLNELCVKCPQILFNVAASSIYCFTFFYISLSLNFVYLLFVCFFFVSHSMCSMCFNGMLQICLDAIIHCEMVWIVSISTIYKMHSRTWCLSMKPFPKNG